MIKRGKYVYSRECPCPKCLDFTVKAYEDKVKLMLRPKLPEKIPLVPMVPVRAHFRRQPGYMRKVPRKVKSVARSFMANFIRGLANGLTKD